MRTDWRLQGQEDYLMGVELWFKKYKERITDCDHDHCEFCSVKFSEELPETLDEGYSTSDDYRWICSECYSDFKLMFKFKVK